MTKTKFKIYIWPEIFSDRVDQIEKMFDDFKEAFGFLMEECDRMQERLRSFGADSEEEKSGVCWAIEFINSENMYRHAIAFDMAEFFLKYEHDNTVDDIGILLSEDYLKDPETYDAVFGFVVALNAMGKIVL